MEEKIRNILSGVIHPETQQDIVSSGIVESVSAEGGKVLVKLSFAKAHDPFAARLRTQAQQMIERALPDLKGNVTVVVKEAAPRPQPQPQRESTTRQVRHIIAVASGKGGVGKSTVTANLAIALRNMGYTTGILDADIYGPSQPKMFGIEGYVPDAVQKDGNDYIVPAQSMGIELMSIGFFIRPEDALMWRGAMATNALRQLLHQTLWDKLDYLLIDMPPGTGDIHLTIISDLKMDGAVIVAAGSRGGCGARCSDVPPSAGERAGAGHHREYGVVHAQGAARQPLLYLRPRRGEALRRGVRCAVSGRDTYHTVDYGGFG